MDDLFNLTKKTQANAYAPISHYNVGATLICKSGKIFHGCNVEDSSTRCGCCAERVAFFSAITAGEKEFEKIILIGSYKNKPLDKITPCGTCRQFMSELCDDNFEIINYYEENNSLKSCKYKLIDIFPNKFTL